MIEDEYLSVLSKIMGEHSKETDDLNNLYHIIDEELYNNLEEVEFPSMPELSGRLNKMLVSIKALSICPEIAHKEVIAIYNHFTNNSFESMRFDIKRRDCSWIMNCQTQIPIALVNADKMSIEIVSNSFEKISLTKEEYKILLTQSNKNRVALNRLVKFIYIKLPFCRTDKCYLLDNTYHVLSELFEELICTRIYQISENDIKFLKPWYFNKIDYIMCNDKEFNILAKEGLVKDSKIAHINTLEPSSEIYKNKSAIISFIDILKYSTSSLCNYYSININYLKTMQIELTNDLIRDDNEVLSKFNDETKEKLKGYLEAEDVINGILYRLQGAICEIDQKYDIPISNDLKILTDYLKDCIFEYFFSVVGVNIDEEKLCIKRLTKFGYIHQDILLAYSKSINGISNKGCNTTFTNEYDWEYAKMLIHFSENAECTENIAKMLLCIGKERLTTGKEWYYWSLLYDDENALKTSLQLGCDMACDKYYQEQGEDYNTKRMLTSVLYPDACIERGIQEALDAEPSVKSIEDKRLAYLKIAASVGDDRGVQIIVDILYDNVVWEYFSTKGAPIKNSKPGGNLQEVCGTLLGLCNYLVSKKIEISKNKERIAIINFCLNRNLSDVHSSLYSKGTDAAYYCKGYLAEYGLYNSKNLDKALASYDKVSGSVIPAVINAKKRVKSKIATREKAKIEEYDEDEDYSGYSSSSTVDSSWCFITTAASCALNKGRDCDELNFLRKFRDEHIKGTDQGNALVAEYYSIAPKIIEEVDKESNSSEIYAELWTTYIAPSAKMILEEKWQEAQDIYVAMVVDLSKKYDIKINTEGYEELYHSTLKRIGYES